MFYVIKSGGLPDDSKLRVTALSLDQNEVAVDEHDFSVRSANR